MPCTLWGGWQILAEHEYPRSSAANCFFQVHPPPFPLPPVSPKIRNSFRLPTPVLKGVPRMPLRRMMIAALPLFLLLQACVPVVVGGAAVGAGAGHDRGSLGGSIEGA